MEMKEKDPLEKEQEKSKKNKGSFQKYAQQLEVFISSISAESGLSENTSLAYRSDLEHFGKFICFNLQKEIGKTKKNDVREYISYISQLEMESTSISRKISSIKRFFKHLASEGKIDQDPSASISSPKAKIRLPKYINKENVEKMAQQCREEGGIKGLRDELIIEMIHTTGLRVSELITVKTSTMLQCIKESQENDSTAMMRVVGKGNKERFVPITKSVVRLAKKYINKKNEGQSAAQNAPQNNQQNQQQGASLYLFTSHQGGAHGKLQNAGKEKPDNKKSGKKKESKHITREAVGAMLKQRAKQAGVDWSAVSPHVLRHSFATNLCNSDVSIRFVQELLGHSSISTTEIYLHTLEDKMTEFIEENHPLATLGRKASAKTTKPSA